MAKISARGATEIARVKAMAPSGYQYILVMCSDGRILSRSTGGYGSDYKIVQRVKDASKRNASYLQSYALGRGLKIDAGY